jgi:uncharacterized membrane protein YidH (DUF202 family)
MYADTIALGYIDPNTSQYVFNLLAPILALLAAAGGLVIAVAALVRHRIASCFRHASWTRRVVTVSVAIGVVAVVALVTWLLAG